MEIFVGLKNHLRRIGCLSYDHSYKKFINICQYLFFIIFIFIHISTLWWFFIFEAKTFTEYVESFIPAMNGLIILQTHCVFLCQRKKLWELMTEIECMIKDRKWN